jgi:Flavin containing amine oxidoreductase
MGLQSFLQFTTLPNWFPLSNLKVGQQKVLSMLNMKKDSSGNVVWDDSSKPFANSSILNATPAKLIPMEPRSRYRVCVVGGGIAGLSCCLELFRIGDRERIDLEVVLVEGRNRLGGRIWTDHSTFKTEQKEIFPADLGASWIHGINLNPLAALATEAGAKFVTTSENVKIYLAGMEEMDPEKDFSAGKLFDDLLDLAVGWLTLFFILLLDYCLTNSLFFIGKRMLGERRNDKLR